VSAQADLLSKHINHSGETCFTSKVDGGQFRLVLPQIVRGDQIAVDIHLATARPLTLTPFVISPPYGPPQTAVNQLPETVPAGNHRMVAAFRSTPAGVVGFTDLNAGADFCILGVQVAAVGVASLPHTNQCQNVDMYGSQVGTRGPCGVKWQ
jgi:hypothetical protein